MADIEPVLLNELRKQRLIVMAALAAISLGGLLQSNERALAQTEAGMPPVPGAFAAIVPTGTGSGAPGVGIAPGPRILSAPPRTAFGRNAGAPQLASAAPAGGGGDTGAPLVQQSAGDTAPTAGPTIADTTGGGDNGAPVFQDTGPGPSLGLGGPVLIASADTGGTPGGVPEPATWLVMILGIGGIGGLLRRARAQAGNGATQPANA